MGAEEAQGHLVKARQQCERAAVASWSPPEPDVCVTFAFYAYENGIVAVAEAIGRKWTKNHYEKAKLAADLTRDGVLRTNIQERLLTLNDLRKDISYGVPGPDMSDVNLEKLVEELKAFLEEEVAPVVNQIPEGLG